MRLLLIVLFVCASAWPIRASVMPLTTKEISLMLRSGYSSEAVLRELSKRHFADTIDSEVEKQLVHAGANESLVETLRSGQYQLSASEIAIAKEKLATQQQRTTESLEHSTKTETAEGADAASPPNPPTPSDTVYRLLKGDLVYWHQGSLSRYYDDNALEKKKLYLFFFSANWTKPGRKFTAQLVEYYNRVVPDHPELEVIFFSADSSQFGMNTYMSQSNMPWPAIAYDKLATKAVMFDKNLVHGIPSLILVDGSGNIVSNSGAEGKDSDLAKVLVDLDKIFARGKAGPVAQTH